jgi:hypothetical protein
MVDTSPISARQFGFGFAGFAMASVLFVILIVWLQGGRSVQPRLCDGGVELIEGSDGKLGRCYQRQYIQYIQGYRWKSEVFHWEQGATTVPFTQQSEPERSRWRTMDRLDVLLDRIGGMFERWLAEFEEKPVRVGFKILAGVVVIRWVYRFLNRK